MKKILSMTIALALVGSSIGCSGYGSIPDLGITPPPAANDDADSDDGVVYAVVNETPPTRTFRGVGSQ